MNIWGLRSNFVDCEYFLESNSPDILALCEKPGWLNWFSIARGYLSLIQKGSTTHMHGHAVYVKEAPRFAQDLSLENSGYSYLCFWLALRHSVFYFVLLC